MITQNQTPANDNQLIFIIQIILDTVTYRFCYWNKDITLSGNVYKSGVIELNTLQNTGREVSFSGNKYIGSVGALSFSLSKLTGINLDQIQPTTGAPFVINRNVRLGYMWEGATSEDQITYQDEFFIEEIKSDAYRLKFSCVDRCELDFITIPFYTVQKDYDNGVSYYPYAPVKNFGAVLPIVYGHFNDLKPDIEYFKLVPTVCVDKRRLEFKVASHSCYATGGGTVDYLGDTADAFKYQREANTYTFLNASGVQFRNTLGGHTVSLLSTSKPIKGTIYLQLKKAGQHSAFPEINIPTIEDTLVYTALTNQTSRNTNWLSWQLDTSLSSASLGTIRSYKEEDLAFCVKWETGDVNQKHIDMRLVRNDFYISTGDGYVEDESGESDKRFVDFTGYDTLANGQGELQFALYTGWAVDNNIKTKRTQDLPWTIEEVQDIEFLFKHISPGATNYVNIRNAYVVIRNFTVASLDVDSVPLRMAKTTMKPLRMDFRI